MSEELIIHFDTPTQFKIRFADDETEVLTFHSPINDAEYQDIRWYLEKYSTEYTDDPDDERATRIAEMLPTWGFNRLLHIHPEVYGVHQQLQIRLHLNVSAGCSTNVGKAAIRVCRKPCIQRMRRAFPWRDAVW